MKALTTGIQTMAIIAALLPAAASAFTLNQVLGFFNIIVGLFLTIAIISFGTGMFLYATRYGTMGREKGFPFMQFGITALFVLSVLIALVRYFAGNTEKFLYLIAVIAFIFAGGLLAYSFKDSGNKNDKH